MHALKRIPFAHDGKDYEIRVMGEGESIRIEAFDKDKRANGYSYQLTIDESQYFSAVVELDVINRFIEMAKEDVVEHRWEELLNVLKSHGTNRQAS